MTKRWVSMFIAICPSSQARFYCYYTITVDRN